MGELVQEKSYICEEFKNQVVGIVLMIVVVFGVIDKGISLIFFYISVFVVRICFMKEVVNFFCNVYVF